MNVLLDTDVLIDVALDRKPFSDYSSRILDAAESKAFKSFIAWHSIANFYYIVSSENDSGNAVEFITESYFNLSKYPKPVQKTPFLLQN